MSNTDPLKELVVDGYNATNDVTANRWLQRADAFVTVVLDVEDIELFRSLTSQGDEYERVACALGFLQGLMHKSEVAAISLARNGQTATTKNNASTAVFIVHGQNSSVKEQAARFVEKVGLKAIILHEQANAGATIIEKFEHFSDVAFALVILTDDDLGYSKKDIENIQPRARQNVIFELGYFIGKLGRNRVCALYSNGVELPSDFNGIVYVPLDESGAWKTKLAQEFVQASMPIDISGLLR